MFNKVERAEVNEIWARRDRKAVPSIGGLGGIKVDNDGNFFFQVIIDNLFDFLRKDLGRVFGIQV